MIHSHFIIPSLNCSKNLLLWYNICKFSFIFKVKINFSQIDLLFSCDSSSFPLFLCECNNAKYFNGFYEWKNGLQWINLQKVKLILRKTFVLLSNTKKVKQKPKTSLPTLKLQVGLTKNGLNILHKVVFSINWFTLYLQNCNFCRIVSDITLSWVHASIKWNQFSCTISDMIN